MSGLEPPQGPATASSEFNVRRLHPGDEQAFIACATIDHEFEHEPETAEQFPPPTFEAARTFLSDPAVRFWLAEADGQSVGQLHCCVVALGTGASEMLLYSIGTRVGWRRRGIATALVDAMTELMRAEGLEDVWVPSAKTAIEFYTANGFAVDEGVFMTKSIGAAT